MKTLNSHKTQKLIDYKNKLIDDARLAYDYSIAEMEPINERNYLIESNVKEKIANDIEAIIYGDERKSDVESLKEQAEGKYKMMTEQLRLTHSDEEVGNYFRWIITSDAAKECWKNS